MPIELCNTLQQKIRELEECDKHAMKLSVRVYLSLMRELTSSLDIISAIVGGTALPMHFCASVSDAGKAYSKGKPCNMAASLTEIPLFCSGCPNLPLDIVRHLHVRVGEGLSQLILP